MGEIHIHHVVVAEEDTDFSGLVYHANYLRYFEGARADLLGIADATELWRGAGLGLMVYRANLSFNKGAAAGDQLEIHSTVDTKSSIRWVFRQGAWRAGDKRALVEAEVQIVCVDGGFQLTSFSDELRDRVTRFSGASP